MKIALILLFVLIAAPIIGAQLPMRSGITFKVFSGNGGWWASMEREGHYLGRMERGPYPFRWMATLAFPIQRWTW